MKLNKSIIAIIVITCISQASLGLFDPIESRQNIGEHVAHSKALVTNFPDGGTDCSPQSEYSSGMSFPEFGGCWHYRSRSIVGELVWIPAGLLGDNYPAMKSYALLISMIELLVIYSFVSHYFGNFRGILATLAYASIPAFIYYAQAPMIGHLRIILILLTARFSIPHFVDRGSSFDPDEEKSNSGEFAAWMLLIFVPAFGTLLAFAWAGFGLTLAILRLKGKDASLLAIFSFFLAPVFWFYFNYKINHIFGYGNQFISRFNARSDFSLFIDPSFYIEFFDEFTNQAGPIGILLLFLLFSNAGRIAKWEPAPLSAVIALSSLLLFTLVLFQSTFIECCPYLAYPIIALSSFGVMEINIDRSEASTVFVVMLLASFVGGASLHGVENNYTERELQEYVINEIESEDGLVVTDHQISRWNAYRWQIPGGTIHISADYSPNDFHDLISIVAPEHIILSNESFLSVEASSMGEKLGYCFEEIETDEQIPENWVEGWMSDIYPIRAGKRC